MLKKTLIVGAILLVTVATSSFIISNDGNKVSAQCNIFYRRGCCSHHGGVCGCKSNRALCCDGSLSPSCGCD